MYTALEWLNPLVHLAGLVVAGWAYSVSRKRGYILVAIYFLLAVISLTLVPAINAARYRRWQAQHQTSESDQAWLREFKVLEQKYPRHYAPAARISIPIPLGTAILVAGLWVLARETRKEAEPIGSANAASPRR